MRKILFRVELNGPIVTLPRIINPLLIEGYLSQKEEDPLILAIDL